jgi:hypothetical protein
MVARSSLPLRSNLRLFGAPAELENIGTDLIILFIPPLIALEHLLLAAVFALRVVLQPDGLAKPEGDVKVASTAIDAMVLGKVGYGLHDQLLRL